MYTQTLYILDLSNIRSPSISILAYKIRLFSKSIPLALIVFICTAQADSARALDIDLLEATEFKWQLKRDRQGIKIYTSAIKGSKYRAIRSSIVIKAPLASIIALIKDSAACSKWADMCKHSEVHQTVSATENYIYTYNNLPFPIKDRDILAHVQWKIDTPNKVVSMLSSAVSGIKESNPRAIRLSKAIAKWQFTAQENGSVLVENIAHIDPNGPIPAWISNRLMVSSPYKTLLKMRRLAESGAYDTDTISFLDF